MGKKVRTWSLWLLALILVLLSAAYQRRTGPSYPVRGEARVGGAAVRYELLRSHVTGEDAAVRISAPGSAVSGRLEYRRFRSHDEWTRVALERSGDVLAGSIPKQPPAGKVMYRVWLESPGRDPFSLTEEPVIIRFRGPVPGVVLIPHIVLMFAAMLLACRTGLEALFGRSNTYRLSMWTAVLLFVGGMILGPVVQKYAFGAFWTGWPLGTDLTDNKTAVAMLLWILSIGHMRRMPGARAWPMAAAIVTLAVYLIPHSLWGSELDHTIGD